MKSLVLFSIVALIFSATAVPIAGPTTGCSAVHFITARASTEAPGEGIIGAVVTSIIDASKQTCSREAVAYPATLTDYLVSEGEGVVAMKALLAAQAASCPSTKIVLMGYSQGAQVAGDVLAADATGSNKGTANALNGLFPRPPGALNAFASVIESFCDIGDPFCAGGADLAVHLGYVEEYGAEAASFVLSQIGG
ncbi:hypothetical protein H0H92_003925 [Tricholoma furcatifolium]|nr:hypothetical protein H0H92_003925 [Tricholoma furcatifolium]